MAEKKEVKKDTKKEDKSTVKNQSPAKEAPVKHTDESAGKEKEEEKEESYLKDIMAIGGHGGLFRFISQGRNGIIVESLEDGKRMQAFATMKVSSLEDIAIYTEEEEIQLDEVFRRIHKYENGSEAISHKSDVDDLKDYFSAVLPEYDRDRVYISDIKKVISWYNFLLGKDMLKVDKPKIKSGTKAEAEKNSDESKSKAEPAK